MGSERLVAVGLAVGFWIPLAVCTYLAFDPSPSVTLFRVSDIILHAFAFTYLTFALGLAHRHRHWLVPGGWMFAYGVIIEAVQAFEPQRAAELKDLAVDFAGICIGLTLMPWLGPRVRSWGDRLAILIVNDGS